LGILSVLGVEFGDFLGEGGDGFNVLGSRGRVEDLIELVGGWSGGEVRIETIDIPLFAAAGAVHQDDVGHEVELVDELGGGEVSWVRIADGEAAGPKESVALRLEPEGEAREPVVELTVALYFGAGHVLEDAALLGGLPGRVIEGDRDRIPVEAGGKLVELCAGVIVDVDEDVEVALEDGSKAAELSGCDGEAVNVDLALDAQGLSGVGDLMAVMEVLDGLFEADGDEEAEDDGGDVDEEVAPGAGGVVWRVDVEHGCGFLWGRGGLEGRGGGFAGWDVFRRRGVFRLRRWEGRRRVRLGRWRLIWRAIGHRLLR
jgi:hypothetical protein